MKLIADQLGHVIPVSHIVKVSDVKETSDSFSGKRSTFNILITTGMYINFYYDNYEYAVDKREKLLLLLEDL